MDKITEIQQHLEKASALLESLKTNPINNYEDWEIIINAGHGGNNPEGKYMTPPWIGKLYKFTDAPDFEIREGVCNRIIANKVCDLLEKAGIKYHKLYHEYIDIALPELTRQANQIDTIAKTKGKKTILLSFHSNAHGMEASGSGNTANGWEVFTTKKTTASDKFADIWYEQTRLLLGDKINYRLDVSDGDYDKEANFWILWKTTMPAILVECLFFTNRQDALKLLNEQYQSNFAQAAFNAIIKYCKS